MATADKLNKLIETKANIKEAIKAKGVTVNDSDTFASYPSKITSINGGGDKIILPESTKLPNLILLYLMSQYLTLVMLPNVIICFMNAIV